MDIVTQGEPADYIREVIVNYKGPRRKSPVFDRPEAVTAFLRGTLLDNSREHFIVLFLDSQNRVIGYSITSIGTKNRCPVHPAEIFQKALLVGATSIIVAHNHPSGESQPSEEDRTVTKRLSDAGRIVGVPLLDHFIVTEEEHYSFADHGFIECLRTTADGFTN